MIKKKKNLKTKYHIIRMVIQNIEITEKIKEFLSKKVIKRLNLQIDTIYSLSEKYSNNIHIIDKIFIKKQIKKIIDEIINENVLIVITKNFILKEKLNKYYLENDIKFDKYFTLNMVFNCSYNYIYLINYFIISDKEDLLNLYLNNGGKIFSYIEYNCYRDNVYNIVRNVLEDIFDNKNINKDYTNILRIIIKYFDFSKHNLFCYIPLTYFDRHEFSSHYYKKEIGYKYEWFFKTVLKRSTKEDKKYMFYEIEADKEVSGFYHKLEKLRKTTKNFIYSKDYSKLPPIPTNIY
jgi:hypothetical protein